MIRHSQNAINRSRRECMSQWSPSDEWEVGGEGGFARMSGGGEGRKGRVRKGGIAGMSGVGREGRGG